MICERCGKEHDGSFGSGRFCSRSCANARTRTEESRKKTSESIRQYNEKMGRLSRTTRRDIKRKIYEKELKEYLDCIQSSPNMKILQYPEIDFGNKYVITDSGSVISTKTRKEMVPGIRDAYYWVCLTDLHRKKHCLYVHRLVAYNFIPNPDSYPIINHKDENPMNNHVDNLEWCTYSYNNTYNDVHMRRGKKVSETMKRKNSCSKDSKNNK